MPYSNSTTATDRLRFLVGDTSTSASGELLSTGEANYLLGQYGSPRAAAPHAARALAAYYANQADKYVGDLRIFASQKAAAFFKLADALKLSVAIGAVPFAGGLVTASGSTKAPQFTVGMHDFLNSPQGRTRSTAP